jgi:hypothetical protein
MGNSNSNHIITNLESSDRYKSYQQDFSELAYPRKLHIDDGYIVIENDDASEIDRTKIQWDIIGIEEVAFKWIEMIYDKYQQQDITDINTSKTININEVNTNEVNINEVNTNEVNTNEVNTNEVNTNTVNTNEICDNQNLINEITKTSINEFLDLSLNSPICNDEWIDEFMHKKSKGYKMFTRLQNKVSPNDVGKVPVDIWRENFIQNYKQNKLVFRPSNNTLLTNKYTDVWEIVSSNSKGDYVHVLVTYINDDWYYIGITKDTFLHIWDVYTNPTKYFFTI